MAWSSKIADLFAEFSVKGVKTFSDAMQKAETVVKGFAMAGLAGTVQSERLQFQMQRFSREVGSLFLPAMETATKALEGLTSKFRMLSGEQQDAIGKSLLLGAAITRVGFAINPTVGFLSALSSAILVSVTSTEKGTQAFQKMEAALLSMGRSAAPVLENVTSYLASRLDRTAVLWNKVADLAKDPSWKNLGEYGKALWNIGPGQIPGLEFDLGTTDPKKSPHKNASLAGGGFSAPTDFFKSIQTEALLRSGGGADPNQETAKNTEEANALLGAILGAIVTQDPAIGVGGAGDG